jgi:hypothetical protein
MTKQLQECINSGQVSAAQVVAHQEAGDLALCPICGEGRVTTHMEADDLIFKRCDTCRSEFAGTLESRINKRFAALAAALEVEREKARVLRELLIGKNGALIRMDRARAILTNDNPTPNCNWGMLDTADLSIELTAT